MISREGGKRRAAPDTCLAGPPWLGLGMGRWASEAIPRSALSSLAAGKPRQSVGPSPLVCERSAWTLQMHQCRKAGMLYGRGERVGTGRNGGTKSRWWLYRCTLLRTTVHTAPRQVRPASPPLCPQVPGSHPGPRAPLTTVAPCICGSSFLWSTAIQN